MTDEPARYPLPTSLLRVSDAERERVAEQLRAAAGEGRLTLAESDERQAAAYAASTREDLAVLTADLPRPDAPERPSGRALSPAARRRLAVHATIVAVIAISMVVRWALGPVWFFWPLFPAFWLAVSVLVHYRVATRPRGFSAAVS